MTRGEKGGLRGQKGGKKGKRGMKGPVNFWGENLGLVCFGKRIRRAEGKKREALRKQEKSKKTPDVH